MSRIGKPRAREQISGCLGLVEGDLVGRGVSVQDDKNDLTFNCDESYTTLNGLKSTKAYTAMGELYVIVLTNRAG